MQKVQNISFKNIKLNNGFWKERYNLNKTATLRSVYERFEETGRFDALRFNYNENKIYPHFFFDSDVAKWIEAVGYLIKLEGGYEEEQKVIDELVVKMKENQYENGYLNSHFIQIRPEQIFTIRGDHELYCAGHLIEGAIAYHEATNKNGLLDVMIKYVDCIEKAFIIDKTASFTTCGHEEIELALLKLYEHTNNQKYLDMALFFINERGVNKEVSVAADIFNSKYDQSEMPVRDLTKAEGHAVRAVYLYIAMSEAALKTNDERLYLACDRLFDDIVNKKMYITGGIGSAKQGESFTVDYDLPNLEAYSESCAAIGLLLFAVSMQKFGRNAKFADVIEKVMYNNLLSSTSLDGKAFFYENPLEIHLASVDKETAIIPERRINLPIRHRLEVFDCSCCPPNIARTIAKIGEVILSESENELIINQYVASEYQNDKINFKMSTNFPHNGKIKIKVKNNSYEKLSIRIPSWCDHYSVKNVNYTECDQYIEITNLVNGEFEIDFEMEAYFVEANPLVRDDNGKVALCYGPTVYCLEKLDNDFNLGACTVLTNKKIKKVKNKDYSSTDFVTDGLLDSTSSKLYKKLNNNKEKVKLHFKPYYTFANRDECDMIVWVRK